MSVLQSAIDEVCEKMRVTPQDLFSPLRTRRVSRARWQVFAILAAEGWTVSQIAAPWGFDRSTVLHGLKMVGGRLARLPSKRGVKNGNQSRHFVDQNEARRAEIIKQYWAQRGVTVETQIESISLRRGHAISATRSTGIPVRSS